MLKVKTSLVVFYNEVKRYQNAMWLFSLSIQSTLHASLLPFLEMTPKDWMGPQNNDLHTL
jgi:hypothetical protein